MTKPCNKCKTVGRARPKTQKFLTFNTPSPRQGKGKLSIAQGKKGIHIQTISNPHKTNITPLQPKKTQCHLTMLSRQPHIIVKVGRGWTSTERSQLQSNPHNFFSTQKLTMVVLLPLSKTILSFSTQRFKEDLMSDSIGSGNTVSAIKKEKTSYHYRLR